MPTYMSIAGFKCVQDDVFCDVDGSELHVISGRRRRRRCLERTRRRDCTFDKPVNHGYQSARGSDSVIKRSHDCPVSWIIVYIYG